MLFMLLLVQMSLAQFLFPTQDYYETKYSTIRVHIDGTNCSLYSDRYILLNIQGYTNRSYYIDVPVSEQNIYLICMNASTGTLYTQRFRLNITRDFELIAWNEYHSNFNYYYLYPISEYNITRCFVNDAEHDSFPIVIPLPRPLPESIPITCEYNKSGVLMDQTIEAIDYLHQVNTRYEINLQQNDCDPLEFSNNSSIYYMINSNSNCNNRYYIFNNITELQVKFDYYYNISQHNYLVLNRSRGIVNLYYYRSNVKSTINLEDSDITIIIYQYMGEIQLDIVAINSTVKLIFEKNYDNKYRIRKVNLSAIDGSISIIENYAQDFTDYIQFNLSQTSFLKSYFAGNVLHRWNYTSLPQILPLYIINSTLNMNSANIFNRTLNIIDSYVVLVNTSLSITNISFYRGLINANNVTVNRSTIILKNSTFSIRDLISTGNTSVGLKFDYSLGELFDTKICGYSLDVESYNSQLNYSNLTCDVSRGIICSNTCSQDSSHLLIRVYSEQSIENAPIIIPFNPKLIQGYSCEKGRVGKNETELYDTYIAGRCNGPTFIFFRANLSAGYNRFKFYYNMTSSGNLYEIINTDNSVEIKQKDVLFGENSEVNLWFDPRVTDSNNISLKLGNHTLVFISDGKGILLRYLDSQNIIARFTSPSLIRLLRNSSGLFVYSGGNELIERFDLSYELDRLDTNIKFSNLDDQSFVSMIEYPSNAIFGNIINQQPLNISVYSPYSQREGNVYFNISLDSYRDLISNCNYSKYINIYHEGNRLNTQYFCDPATGYLLIAFKTNLTAGKNNFTLVLQDAIENNGELKQIYGQLSSDSDIMRNTTIIIRKTTPNYFSNDLDIDYYSRFTGYINEYYDIDISFSNSNFYPYYTGSFTNLYLDLFSQTQIGVYKSSMEYFYKLYLYKNLSNPIYTLDPGYYEIRINTEYLTILDPYSNYIDYYNFSRDQLYSMKLSGYIYEIGILIENVSTHDFYVSIPSLNNKIIGNSIPNLNFEISDEEFGYVLYSDNQILNPIFNSHSQIHLENMTIYGSLIISAPAVVLRNITVIGKNGMKGYYAVYNQDDLFQIRNLSCHYGGSNIGFGGSPRQPGHKPPHVNIYWRWKEDYPSSDPNSYNGGWIYINASTVNISNIYLNGWNGGAGGGLFIDATTSDVERVFANGEDVLGCKGAGGGGIVYINSTTVMYRDVYVNGGNANNPDADHVADGGSGVIFISRGNYTTAIFDNNRTNRNIPIQSFLARDVDELIIRNGATVEQFKNRINLDKLTLQNYSTYTSPAYPYSTFYIVKVFANDISIDSSSKIDVSSKGIIPVPSVSSCTVEFDDCRNYVDTSYIQLLFDSGGILELNFKKMELNGSLVATTYNVNYRIQTTDKAGKIFLNGINITGNGSIDASYTPRCDDELWWQSVVFNGLIYYNITGNDEFIGSKLFFVNNGECTDFHDRYSPGAYFDVKNKRLIIGNDSIRFSDYVLTTLSYYRAYDADVVITNTYMKYLNVPNRMPNYNFRHLYYPQIFRNVSIIKNSIIEFDYSAESSLLSPVPVLNNTLQSMIIEQSNITAINTFFELNNMNLILNQSRLISYYELYNLPTYYSDIYSYRIYRLNYTGSPAVITQNYNFDRDTGRGGSHGGIAANELDVRDFTNRWAYTQDDNLIRAVMGNVSSISYGDYRTPNETGSPGLYSSIGYYSGIGYVSLMGLAGGVIKIFSDTVQIENSYLDVFGRNGGSGGSIYINVTNAVISNSILNASGTGIIFRTGYYYNPKWKYIVGGGGRIAIHFKNLSLMYSSIIAYGGNASVSSNLEYIGGAGTIYMFNKTSNTSKIIIVNMKPTKSSICLKDQYAQQGYTPITLYDNDPVEEIYVENALVHIKSTKPIPRLILVNSSLSHPQYPFSTTEHVNLTIIDFIINNSVINVSSCGNVMGPGYTGIYSAASYGGLGQGAPSSSVYGILTDPSALGSGSHDQAGGGVARIYIDGNLVGDNLIIDASGEYHSSGGSIMLFIYNRTIPTVLIARGGTDAGGGRVAIYLGFNNSSAPIICDVDGGYSSPQGRGTCFTGLYFNLVPISLNPGPLRLNDIVLLSVEMRLFNRSTNTMQVFSNGMVTLIDSTGSKQFQVNSTDSRYYLNFSPTAPGKILYLIEGRYSPNTAARYIAYRVTTLGYFINISLNKPIYFPGENAIARISIFKYPEAISYSGPAMIYYRGIYLGNISIINGHANYTFNVGNTGGYHEFNVVIDTDD